MECHADMGVTQTILAKILPHSPNNGDRCPQLLQLLLCLLGSHHRLPKNLRRQRPLFAGAPSLRRHSQASQ
ncbi:hypothetical protein D3C85_1713470 [compost metagenome]